MMILCSIIGNVMEDWLHMVVLEEANAARRESTQRMRARRREIRNGITDPIDDISDREFKNLYRLPKPVVRTIIDEIRDAHAMPASTRLSAISVESKV